MFLFTTKRAKLLRRLEELQLRPPGPQRAAVAAALLKRLPGPVLASLVQAVETGGGGGESLCCLVAAGGRVRLGRHAPATPPHLLTTQLFRWTDCREEELTRLPVCPNTEPGLTCLNPWHWGRLLPGPAVPLPAYPSPAVPSPADPLPTDRCSPPPPYSTGTASREEGLDSVATGGSGPHNSGDTSWCRLAYWEERTRVGRQVGVRTGAVEVFGRTGGSSSRSGQVDSVSLASLAQHNLSPSPATTRTREKIGQGVILSRDDAGVWAYNRSEVPVFVNSPTLDVPNSRTFSVLKIPPGYTLQIFSWEVSRLYARLRDPALQDGPFDPHAVRISFAKGWGEHYSRQFVDCCPCWLEILLLPPR